MSSGSSGIRAGRAFVELGVSDQLTKGLKAAEHRLSQFGESLRSVGYRAIAASVAIYAPMALAVKTFASTGEDLEHMSERTGIAAESLSELRLAIQVAQLETQDFENAVKKMSVKIADAASGGESARESLAALGVNLADLAKSNPEQQFSMIADAISRIRNPTERAAAAVDIFGRAGTKMLPMLMEGSRGIEEWKRKARELGLSLGGDTIAAGAKLHRSFEILWLVLKQTATIIGAALGPAVQSASDRITRVTVAVNRFIDQNRQLVTTVAQVTAYVAAVGAAFVVAGTLIGGLAKGIGTVLTIGKVVGIASNAVAMSVAALLSPLGLVVAAAVGIGVAFAKYSGVAAVALNWLAGQFQSLKDTVSTIVGAIGTALAEGNIDLAAKVLWASLKMVWEEGVWALKKTWFDFKAWMLKGLFDLKWGAIAFFVEMGAGMQSAAVSASIGILKTWNWLTEQGRKMWADAAYFYTKTWIKAQALITGEDEHVTVKKLGTLAESYLGDRKDIEEEARRWSAAYDRSGTQQQAKIDQEEHAQLTDIGKQSMADETKFNADRDTAVQAAQVELDKAKADWQKALQQVAARKPGGANAIDNSILDRLKKALAGVDDELKIRSKKIELAGTFSGFATYGMGQGTAQDRTAKATEEAAAHLAFIRRHGQARFA